ncbi:MAG: 4'-phosphopantetheinyl transferase superfamily protein [Marinifilaceae bacterium]
MKVFGLKIPGGLEETTRNALLDFVDESKRDRLLKYVFPEDLQRGLFADLLVRKILLDTCRLSNDEIYFSTNDYGKPYCEFLDDFHFNVSHSGEWVVCAVGKKPVGIDIEQISKIDLDISKNFFSDKEYADVLSSDKPYDFFFTLWSLKESYIKFLGKGLSHPLNSFSMRFLSDTKIHIEINDKIEENINFKEYGIEDGYKMAVCCMCPNLPESPVIYTFNDLVDTFIPTSA